MKKMKIKVSFFGILMLAALALTHSYISLAALLAAALHECGHIAAAKLCSIPLRELKLGIFGAALTPEKVLCSYKKEILLAAAGPLINILSVFLLLPYRKELGEFGELFIAASLFLGLLNLLPVEDFDGGRILSCLLSQAFSPRLATAVCNTLSFLFILCLWILSVYMLLRRSSSLSLFVFSLALFCKIFVGRKNQINGGY